MEPLVLYTLLFCGSFLAAAISGAAGFGGALLLLPLLTATLGTTQAVPILTIAQLIGNLSRVYLGYKEIQWKPVGYFLLGAVPMTIIGSLSFVSFDKGIVTRIIGVAIIVFVVLKYYKLLKFEINNNVMCIGGGVVGLVSGLVGSAGPIGASLFLSLDLNPIAYIASEAVTAVVMHITKTIIYQQYLDLGLEVLGTGLFMGLAMMLGTWVGKKYIEKLPKEKFIKFVGILLVIVSLKMVIWG